MLKNQTRHTIYCMVLDIFEIQYPFIVVVMNKIMTEEITLEKTKEARSCLNFCPLEYVPFAAVSPYLSFIALKLKIKPNEISLAWGILGVFGAFVMALGGYWNLLAGILIYQLAIMLDFLDGEMARVLKVKDKIRGSYFDKFFHSTHRGLLMLGLGIGLYNTFGQVIYFYLGIWTCTLFLIDNLSKVKVYEAVLIEGKSELLKLRDEVKEKEKPYHGSLIKKIKFYVPRLLVPNQPLSILVFVILFNISQYYLILMAILAPLFFIKGFVQVYNKLGKMSS